MKNYDERIESIFRKYDEKIKVKQRKRALVRRTAFSVSGFCAAAIVGIFVWKMPYRTNIPDLDLGLPQGSATSVTENASAANITGPATTSGRVDNKKSTASTNAASTTSDLVETTVRSTAINAKTSATTGALMSNTTSEDTSSKTTVQTYVSVQQSTETTIKDPPQTQTEPTTTYYTETISIYQTTTALTTVDQTNTTTNVIKNPDERMILAIENTDYSRSVSEFKNGEKYKYTGNYVKLTDISDFEYIDRFKVYYYFGPIEYEMSSVYKVYTVPNEENKAAVQIDNSDFFLIFEKCIQE